MPKKCPHLFCETQGKKPFDWNKFLTRAYERQMPEPPQKAKSLAANWVTCACGNQCKIIPRLGVVDGSGGGPKDPKLADLGCDFLEYVNEAEWLKAIGCLTLIEQRSAILIERELAKRARKRSR